MRKAPTVPVLVGGLMLAGLLMLDAWHAGHIALSELYSLPAREQIAWWQAHPGNGFDLSAWVDSKNRLLSALHVSPQNADLHESLASLYLLKANRMRSAQGQEPYFRNALEQLHLATELRPSPYTWAAIADIESRRALPERDTAALWQAFDRAMKLGPNEPDVQVTLNRIALAHWDHLPELQCRQAISARERAFPSLHAKLKVLPERCVAGE